MWLWIRRILKIDGEPKPAPAAEPRALKDGLQSACMAASDLAAPVPCPYNHPLGIGILQSPTGQPLVRPELPLDRLAAA